MGEPASINATIMDLHNNAVGLSIPIPLKYYFNINFESLADYVYDYVETDGYWIEENGDKHIPEWANN
ncbi:MAG: hypothetical protein GX638_01595 [Crenarchaeota archaeon]|nr:hypothetical protein [Thermoproteota archaeon]